ncbi:uncharacterized protein LOC131893142 [Tigriopus californicus]|uniref:uncharacterized protein LOC131893142 n=1 Tax=Tigriopus californicus TaxID=6832 RepID=UPI0027DA1831|nr:uncharacterized protein LOC131893142 [Tigriopus californicus]
MTLTNFSVSENMFWRFQCFSHIFFLFSAIVFISVSSGITQISEECLRLPVENCTLTTLTPAKASTEARRTLDVLTSRRCRAYARSIASSTLVCLYGLSLALYSTFSLIINASCGFVRRMVKFHLAFNVVEGVLALANLVAISIFDFAVHSYTVLLQYVQAEADSTTLKTSPFDPCARDLEHILVQTCMPCVIVFLVINILIHACNPIVINHLTGFNVDFRRLVTSRVIIPELDFPDASRPRLPSHRHFPSSPIIMDNRLQRGIFD